MPLVTFAVAAAWLANASGDPPAAISSAVGKSAAFSSVLG
jgi:hypothetical protein